MEKKTGVLTVIAACAIVFLSGCIEQTENNNTVNPGIRERISVNAAGGIYSALDDNVQLTVEPNTVASILNITVEETINPLPPSSLHLYSVYKFEPEGTTFSRPVRLTITYEGNDVPANAEESTSKMYVLNGNRWDEIQGSTSNAAQHKVTADLTHFSTIGCGVNTSSGGGGPSSGGSSSNGTNGSAQYWFKANFYTYSYTTPRLVDWADSDTYYCGVSAYWDPVPYAQYYQIKFMFNGNQPADYGWSCDFRKQGGASCNNRPINRVENYIYQYGGDPNVDGFLGALQTGEYTAGVLNETTGEVETMVFTRIFPEQKHGLPVVEVHDEVEDYEGLSGTDITVLKGQMETFVLDYSNGWEVWVRGVTETES